VPVPPPIVPRPTQAVEGIATVTDSTKVWERIYVATN
jgi:hypothetical protein